MKETLIIIVLSVVMSTSVIAGTPTCHTHSSGNYCQFTGTLSSVYVNEGDVMLFYFDTPVSVSIPASYGIIISNGSAAAYHISDNPDFANYLYSTALAAKLSGNEITIQMRKVESGYLKVDRIWLK